MTSTPRRIVAFVIAGLLCAVAVGIAVWRMSAPDSVVTKPSAATAASSAPATSSAATHSYTITAFPTSSWPKQSQTQVAAPAEDPYLAPNAVVNRTEPAAPTAVYRPDNVSSLQNQQPQVTPNTQYPQAPLSTAPAAPPSEGSTTTAPESPAPGSPQPSSEPTQPPTTPESPTDVPQESPTEDHHAGPQSSGQPQPQPEEPTPPRTEEPSAATPTATAPAESFPEPTPGPAFTESA